MDPLSEMPRMSHADPNNKDSQLLKVDFPSHPSGLSAEEAAKAFLGALAALDPMEQHNKIADLHNMMLDELKAAPLN